MRNRFDRNIRFFGVEGQKILAGARVVVAGAGGLGTHVIQGLAYLGVGAIVVIDKEVLDETNLNRYVLAKYLDRAIWPAKTDIAEREILAIDPSIQVIKLQDNLVSYAAFAEIKRSDYVIGCFDKEGARFIANEVCSAYEVPYIDCASEITSGRKLIWGGRIFSAWDGTACPVCMNVFDMEEVRRDLGGKLFEEQQRAIYGVDMELLDQKGPSVVSINGIIANYALNEFIVGATDVRKPITLAEYRGQDGKILVSTDTPDPDCYYCKGIRGERENADAERYIRQGVGQWL